MMQPVRRQMMRRIFFMVLWPILTTPLQAGLIVQVSDDGTDLTFQTTGTFDLGSITGVANSDFVGFVSTGAFGILDGSNFTASFVGSQTGSNPFLGSLDINAIFSTSGSGIQFNGANLFWDDSFGATPGVISPTASWKLAGETVTSAFGTNLDNGPVPIWALSTTGDTISIGRAIPEPSTLLLALIATGSSLLRRRR